MLSEIKQHVSSPGFFQRNCWRLGGFDVAVLSDEACRTVRAKYSCMGILVLTTACVACCSASYALNSIFHNPFLGILAGILWSTLIFSLDRFFVSSTRKNAVTADYYPTLPTSPPYRVKISWTALILRFSLALVIGIAVSKPLEVRILQAWIAEAEQEHADDDRMKRTNSMEVVEDQGRVDDLAAQVKTKGDEVATWRNARNQEIDGEAASKKKGVGPNYREKEENLESADREYKNLQEQLDKATQKRDDALVKAKNEAASVKIDRNRELSMITGLEDIEKLKQSKERGSLTRWVSIVITILFVLVETIPVLAKALSPYDPYDAKLDDLEQGAILRSLANVRRGHATSLKDEADERPSNQGQSESQT